MRARMMKILMQKWEMVWRDKKEMSCLQNNEQDSLFGDDCFKEDIGQTN